MEIKEFTSKLESVKKIQDAVSKLHLGTCEIESFSEDGITITVSFKKSKPAPRVIGFH